MGPKIHLLLVITSFLGKFSIKTSSSSSYCQNNQQIDQFKSTIIILFCSFFWRHFEIPTKFF